MSVVKLFIPALGTHLTLEEDWYFVLYHESRNRKLWETLIGNYNSYQKPYGNPAVTMPVVLPKGTVLTVSRIYIRQGQTNFDSITFNCKVPNSRIKGRFWVKLEDANHIVARIDDGTIQDLEPEIALSD